MIHPSTDKELICRVGALPRTKPFQKIINWTWQTSFEIFAPENLHQHLKAMELNGKLLVVHKEMVDKHMLVYQPCAWWSYAEQVLPCRSSFGQHSWHTGPSSWCRGRCGGHLSGSTLHLSAELSLHAKSGSHTSQQHYWGKGDREEPLWHTD